LFAGITAFILVVAMAIISGWLILSLGKLGYILIVAFYPILYPEILGSVLSSQAGDYDSEDSIFYGNFGLWTLFLFLFSIACFFIPTILLKCNKFGWESAILISASIWLFCSLGSFFISKILDFLNPDEFKPGYLAGIRYEYTFCIAGSFVCFLSIYEEYKKYAKKKGGILQY